MNPCSMVKCAKNTEPSPLLIKPMRAVGWRRTGLLARRGQTAKIVRSPFTSPRRIGTMATSILTQRPAWKALNDHYQTIRTQHLRQLFADDPKRGERLTLAAVGIFLDYSKHRVTDQTLKLLIQLANECNLRERIDSMFRGDKINVTENRAVLHIALRAPKSQSIVVDGVNVVPQVHEVLDRMSAFADRIRSGEWKGHTGKPIKNVVN